MGVMRHSIEFFNTRRYLDGPLIAPDRQVHSVNGLWIPRAAPVGLTLAGCKVSLLYGIQLCLQKRQSRTRLPCRRLLSRSFPRPIILRLAFGARKLYLDPWSKKPRGHGLKKSAIK